MKISKERLDTECAILSCIYQDLTLTSEYELRSEYFSLNDTKFFFSLAYELAKKVKEIDELSVSGFVGSNGLIEVFNNYGGYERIENLLNLKANVENIESYIDSLKKMILIERYIDLGINLERKYEISGRNIIPIEEAPYLNCTQFSSLMQSIILDVGVDVEFQEFKLQSLHFTDEEKRKVREKEISDTSHFDIAMTWKTEENEDRYIQSFKYLDKELVGLSRGLGIHVIASTTGVGKSTMLCNVAMALVESGNKVMYVSNEFESIYLKRLMVSYVCSNVFHCKTITRQKLIEADLTDEEYEIFEKANDFIKEKFEGKMTFVCVEEFNFEKITKVFNKLGMTEGYNYLMVDTFKSDDMDSAMIEMVNNSRILDKWGRKNGYGVVMTMQLLKSTDKVSYLTGSQLAFAKQVLDVAHSVLLARRVRPWELNPENKAFIDPFYYEYNKFEKTFKQKKFKIINSQNGGTDKQNEYKKGYLDKSKNYIILFCDKNRSGRTDFVLLYQMDSFGRLTEYGYAGKVSTGMLMQ